MSLIHPTAIVDPTAELAEGVEVGAYAFIGEGVSIGPRSKVHHHATIEGNTTVGAENEFYPYSCLGMRSQDKKFNGGHPGLILGDRNVVREYATMHAATADGNFTRVGSDNLFLAYTHMAHDCVVGNHTIFSNAANIGGHVTVGDRAIIGGLTGIHQFCRVGAYAMVGSSSKVNQDIPPFTISDGNPFLLRGINKIGLERAGYGPEVIRDLRELFRHFFRRGMNRSQAFAAMDELTLGASDQVRDFTQFIQESERGVTPASLGSQA